MRSPNSTTPQGSSSNSRANTLIESQIPTFYSLVKGTTKCQFAVGWMSDYFAYALLVTLEGVGYLLAHYVDQFY